MTTGHRLAALVRLRDDLKKNDRDRQRLLDRRDRRVVAAMEAGDSVTEIAKAAGVKRTYAYQLRDVGRGRKGPIEKPAP